jgi:hypothetical protein
MKNSKLRAGAVALVFALFFALVGAATALAVQVHMVNARSDLQAALSQLEEAGTNKGGHRVNAINYTKDAINEVNLGIQYAE